MRAILPWEDYLLTNVKNEYKLSAPSIMFTSPSQEDFEYVKQVIQNPSGFDSDVFIKTVLAANKSSLQKAIHGNHKVLFYTTDTRKQTPPLTIWFRCIRLLAKDKPVRILYFANMEKRRPPTKGQPILPKHINGGYTNPCNYKTIVIYREEDSTRVLIHELFHASCSDPKKTIPFVEANTEAWAEVLYCAIKARGIHTLYRSCLDLQVKYAVSQANYVFRYHNVKTEKDYAWRYVIGRLKVWKELGIPIPENSKLHYAIDTLRLTYMDIV
jgi:hypothetical protein